MIRYLLIPFLLCLLGRVQAQSHTLSGNLRDAATGEALIGATVFVANQKLGAMTNNYGFYSLSLPDADSLIVVYSYVGYKAQAKSIAFHDDIALEISLMEANVLDDVVITSDRNNENVSSNQMGVIDIPIEKIQQLPAILGEPDLLKIIQTLPGVQPGQEGTTGFFVRGGNSDQNLVQLDEAIVYNPNHLFGLFSTFNTNALNKVTLIKGGFPAQYGGRLSSILDITMKEGNNQQLKVRGGVGLITSNLTIEGPIIKNRASFIVSARRTYLDLLLKPFKVIPPGNSYNFYDINAKVNFKLNDANRLFLSYFRGLDNAAYADASSLSYGIQFGNRTATLRWNHLYSDKLFSNTSVIYNSYLLNLSSVQGKYYSQFYSRINDINAKSEYEFFPNPKHTIKFGGYYAYHIFTPSGKSAKIPKTQVITALDVNKIPQQYTTEFAGYLNDDINISPRLGVQLGLRIPGFIARNAAYLKLEPRATARYSFNEKSSMKASFTVMNQFLHNVPSSTASLPTDIWIPSSKVTKPGQSEQLSLGYFRNFDDNKWEASVETYYKQMQNQVLFKQGAQLLEQTKIDSSLVFGKGWSYGVEFFLKRNVGRFTGWASYTLSKTNQQFKDLNFGKPFPFKYDRRHNLSLVGVYEASKHWRFSSEFIFHTGNAYTLPTGRANFFQAGTLYDGSFVDYQGRNNARLKAYHRLDLAVTRKGEGQLFKRRFESLITLSIYNVYSRRNAYFVYLTVDPNTHAPLAKQVSLLPIIPSLSYNFNF